jgi:hypothetical protein
MNTTGVQSFVVASDSGNGGAMAYVEVLKMIEGLEDVNAYQLGDPGWLTTPGIKGDLKNTNSTRKHDRFELRPRGHHDWPVISKLTGQTVCF